MVKYEYKVFNAKQNKELRSMWKDPGEFEKFLNDKGKNGWKLVKERDLGGVWTMIFQKEIEG